MRPPPARRSHRPGTSCGCRSASSRRTISWPTSKPRSSAVPPASDLRPIDLHFGGAERAIGVYLVETEDGLALFDCGPSSTLEALEAGGPLPRLRVPGGGAPPPPPTPPPPPRAAR